MNRDKYVLHIYCDDDVTVEYRYFPTEKAALDYVDKNGILSYKIDTEHEEERYIIVMFITDITFALRVDDTFRIVSSKPFKLYQRLKYATERAIKELDGFNACKICVFKIRMGESICPTDYIKWLNDENRLMYSIDKF